MARAALAPDGGGNVHAHDRFVIRYLDGTTAASPFRAVAADVATTAAPTADELRLIRDELDPGGAYTK